MLTDKPQIKIVPYRPSNGTEGDAFISSWCGQCARDKSISEGIELDECDDNELCSIIADTMAYSIDDPEYPKEWIIKNGEPCCTAFIESGQAIPTPRCTKTIDMFEALA